MAQSSDFHRSTRKLIHTPCFVLLPSATLFAPSLFYHFMTHLTPSNLQKIFGSETGKVTVSNMNALGVFVNYLNNSEVIQLRIAFLVMNGDRQGKVT